MMPSFLCSVFGGICAHREYTHTDGAHCWTIQILNGVSARRAERLHGTSLVYTGRALVEEMAGGVGHPVYKYTNGLSPLSSA